jgi:uncharacterized membrane protein YidH (DUF202 family)
VGLVSQVGRQHLIWLAPCIDLNLEAPVKLIGIVLIVFGIVALAVGGFTYTTREKIIDIGPLQASADRQKTVPIAPIAGIAAVVGGIVLVVVGSKARA